MGIELRPYQIEAKAVYRKRESEGIQRAIINLPVGMGKTVTGLSLMQDIGGKGLWIGHRDHLLTQPQKMLRAINPSAVSGIVKAERNELDAPIVFASIQTISRPDRLAQLAERRFDFIVADESHHSVAPSYMRVLHALKVFESNGPPLLGLTATVERGDKIGLDQAFQEIVYQIQLLKAIQDGWLVNLRTKQAELNVDLSSINIIDGDYNQGQLGEAMMRSNAAEATADAYQEFASDRKTLIFCVTVDQARRTAEALRKRGVAAEFLCGETPLEERRAILKRLESGTTQVVANCAVLTEGFDEPSISAIIVARPTRSKTLYIQMIGRGSRLYPGKVDCLIVDLVGASSDHKLIQAPVLFGVRPEEMGDQTITEAVEEKEKQNREDALVHSYLIASKRPTIRESIRWIKADPGLFALSAGKKGTVLLIQKPDGWVVEVAPSERSEPNQPLQAEPVDLELAQGIGEDYLRRANVGILVRPQAAWRHQFASSGQLGALLKFGWNLPASTKSGEAADMITASVARSRVKKKW